MTISRAIRNICLERAGGRCERCGRPLTAIGYSLQHRVARGMGGTRLPWVNLPSNLPVLCGSATTGCHQLAETRTATMHGWWLYRHENPRDIRIPALLDTPAAVRFLSCEPLLGPVDLGKYLHPGCHSDSDGDCSWRGCPQIRDGEPAASGRHCPFDRWADYDDDWELPLRPNSIDWCIVGGESGSGARPMYPQWARDLRDQCVAAGVPFLFKQWGQSRPLQAGDALPDRRIVSVDRDQFGYPSFQLSIGKKAAGRELDGRTWDEYPKIGGAT